MGYRRGQNLHLFGDDEKYGQGLQLFTQGNSAYLA